MKLKIQKIKLKNVLKFTDRFINLNSSYRYFSKNFKLNKEYLNQLLNIPIIIFIENGTTFIRKSNINDNDLENLITSVTLKINRILNIQQLILIKMQYNFYYKEIKNKIVSVIFIEAKEEIDYKINEKLSLFLDLISSTKKDTKTLNIDILEKIFLEEDKKLFHNKFEKSISKHFFPQQRKAQIIKKDVVQNHWTSLYIQHNRNYLILEKASKNS